MSTLLLATTLSATFTSGTVHSESKLPRRRPIKTSLARKGRLFMSKGTPSTGINDRCGRPLFSFPALGEIHFTLLGEHDPGADEAIELTQANCNANTVLATTVDPDMLERLGLPEGDKRLQNRPLDEVFVTVDRDGSRVAQQSTRAATFSPLDPYNANYANPGKTTLGDWLKAKGTLMVRCLPNGGANLKLKAEHLVPNGLYTMWAVWRVPSANSAGLPPFTMRSSALGGNPNVLVASDKGRAFASRKLPYCPLDQEPGKELLLLVDLVHHADGGVYGNLPDLGQIEFPFVMPDGTRFSSTTPPGTVAQNHLTFPIHVTPAKESNR